MQYIITQVQAEAAQTHLPQHLLWAYERDDGEWIHDQSIADAMSDRDLDQIVDQAYDAVSYTDWLETLEPANQRHCKIFRYVREDRLAQYEDLERPPSDLNFNTDLTVRLHPQKIWSRGELRETVWYAEVTEDVQNRALIYSDPIHRELRSYSRDITGAITRQTRTIEWYLENGNIHPESKQTEKLYSREEAMSEGRRRRQNVIDRLKSDVLDHITRVKSVVEGFLLGRAFLADLRTEIDLYIEMEDRDDQGRVVLQQKVLEPERGGDWLDKPFARVPGKTLREHMAHELR